MLQPLFKEEETDAEVIWEDQNNINTFRNCTLSFSIYKNSLQNETNPLVMSSARAEKTYESEFGNTYDIICHGLLFPLFKYCWYHFQEFRRGHTDAAEDDCAYYLPQRQMHHDMSMHLLPSKLHPRICCGWTGGIFGPTDGGSREDSTFHSPPSTCDIIGIYSLIKFWYLLLKNRGVIVWKFPWNLPIASLLCVNFVSNSSILFVLGGTGPWRDARAWRYCTSTSESGAHSFSSWAA